MIWLILGSIVPSFATACIAAWLVRRWAPRWDWLDRPGGHKAHAQPMATGGGLAIWLGVVAPLAIGNAVLLFVAGIGPEIVATHRDGLLQQAGRLWLLLAGGTVLAMLGLVDDRRPIPWPIRLAVQTAVATALVVCGFRMSLFIDLPLLTGALSVVWIVGLVNAFNMLDNMDGLAAGVAAIAATILAAVLLLPPSPVATGPQLFIAGLLLVLVGSLLGFLWHNRPPARLFMGDAGSYWIGYLLATATLSATFAGGAAPSHTIMAPLCALAVPLYDMTSVIAIRLWSGRSPFAADRNHFSHRLVALGMTKGQAVLTIYLATATCGLGAFLLHQVDTVGALVVLTMVGCVLLLIAILEAAGGRRQADSSSEPEQKP